MKKLGMALIAYPFIMWVLYAHSLWTPDRGEAVVLIGYVSFVIGVVLLFIAKVNEDL